MLLLLAAGASPIGHPNVRVRPPRVEMLRTWQYALAVSLEEREIRLDDFPILPIHLPNSDLLFH